MVTDTQVPDGWRVVRLGDVAEVVMGQSPPGTTVLDWHGKGCENDGLPFIQGNAEFGAKFPCPTKWCVRPERIAGPGDLLISVRAPVGQTNRADRRLSIGRGLAAIRFEKSAEPFGWHVINHVKGTLERVTQGSTFKAIGGKDLRSLLVPFPPLPEQRAIAAVLDSIDEAIERTESVITATERLRESLLHELLSHGVPGWHSEWKEVRGIGTIPADWGVVRLGEVYEVQLGKMLSPKARQGTNPKPYLTNRNVRWGKFELSDLPTMDFDDREMAKFHLRPGDLLVCEGGEVGRAAVWEGQMSECYYQKALHRLRPVDGNCLSEFMLAILTYYASRDVLIEHSEKTSISHLTRERLLRMRVPNPPRPEQDGIVTLLGHVNASLDRIRDEKERLQVVKASAAEALLTGQLRISV